MEYKWDGTRADMETFIMLIMYTILINIMTVLQMLFLNNSNVKV